MKLYIDTEIGWGIDSSSVAEALAFNSKDSEVELMINSDGGSVYTALEIYDMLRSSNKEIKATILGKAHSAAIIVMLAASKENRKAYSNSHSFIHPVQLFASGNLDSVERSVDDAREAENRIIKIYSERTGASLEDAKNLLYTDKMYFAQDLQNLGFISEILPYTNNCYPSNYIPKKMNTKTTDPVIPANATDKATLLNKAAHFLASIFPTTNVGNVYTYVDSENKELFRSLDKPTDLKVGSIVTDLLGKPFEGTATTSDNTIINAINGVVVSTTIVNTAPVDDVAAQLEVANAKVTELTNKLAESARLIEELQASIASNYIPPMREGTPVNAPITANKAVKDIKDVKAAIIAARNKERGK